MQIYKSAILTHGGSASNPKNSDGTLSAAQLGMNVLKKGRSPLDAVVNAVRHLEDDPRFNAGFGSQIRADGRTVQMDASCMTSTGGFGAVACVEGILNPIDIAKGILIDSQNILLVGDGALSFANNQKIPLIQIDKKSTLHAENVPCCDTVGAIAFDGKTFAAALSSGGIKNSRIGRVGDVPLPGCGLYCGSLGAVACTGDGEFIALRLLAKEIYSWLIQNVSPAKAATKALGLFDSFVDIGVIILTKDEFASNSRHGMAWSKLTRIE